MVILALGTSLQGRQIRTGIGLGVTLTPEGFTTDDTWQPAIFLLLRAKVIKHRPDHRHAERTCRGGACHGSLQIKNITLSRRPAWPTILFRPRQYQPALLAEQTL